MPRSAILPVVQQRVRRLKPKPPIVANTTPKPTAGKKVSSGVRTRVCVPVNIPGELMAISERVRNRIVAVMAAEHAASTNGKVRLARVRDILRREGIDLSKSQAQAFAQWLGFEGARGLESAEEPKKATPKPRAKRRPRSDRGVPRGAYGPSGPRGESEEVEIQRQRAAAAYEASVNAQGKRSLRKAGKAIGLSHERVRQLLFPDAPARQPINSDEPDPK